MGICAVFLDGGYVDKVLLHDHREPRIDLGKLSVLMAEPDELLRAYYYHCLPYQSNPPTEEEKRRFTAKHRFVTALRYLPRFECGLDSLLFAAKTVKANLSSSRSAWTACLAWIWPFSLEKAKSRGWRSSLETAI